MTLTRLLLLLPLLQASSAFACSCNATGTACTSLKGAEAVFVGRVTKDSGEGWGTGPATLVVEETLHGLPKGLREVTVDTMAGTSCYMRLQLDERYVIYGTRIAGTPDGIRVGACSFSFRLSGNESLLSALREAEAGKTARLVGKVRVNEGANQATDEEAAGVKIVATAGRARLETTTKSNGEFEFLNVEPRTYHVTVSSPDFVEDESRWPSEDPTVAASSCGYQSLYVWPNGRIEGFVRSVDGKPLAGVPVQAYTKDQRDRWNTSPFREQKSGDDGAYQLGGLAPGEIAVGINGEKYNDRQPWPPMFYPGSPDVDNATALHLGRGQKQTGIDFALPAPRKSASLEIELVLEDGSPAIDGGANVQNLAGVQRAFILGRETHTNLLKASVYIGETYVIQGFRYASKPDEPVEKRVPVRIRFTSWEGTTGPIPVAQAETHVRVILREVVK